MQNLLDTPIVSSYIDYWKRGLQFRGRTSRSTFWWSALAGMIISLILWFPHLGDYLAFISSSIEDPSAYEAPLELTLFGFLNYLPTLAIYVRRLRDTGKGWKWLFICLVPFIGIFWFLKIMTSPSFEKSQVHK